MNVVLDTVEENNLKVGTRCIPSTTGQNGLVQASLMVDLSTERYAAKKATAVEIDR